MPKPLIHTIMQHMRERLGAFQSTSTCQGYASLDGYTSFTNANGGPPLSSQQQHVHPCTPPLLLNVCTSIEQSVYEPFHYVSHRIISGGGVWRVARKEFRDQEFCFRCVRMLDEPASVFLSGAAARTLYQWVRVGRQALGVHREQRR